MNDNNIHFTSRRYRDQHDFWDQQLVSVDERFFFSGGAGTHSEPGAELKCYEFELSNATQQTISKLSSYQEPATAVVLLSAFMYLLYRFGDQRVICVKSPSLTKSTPQDDGGLVLLIAEIDDRFTVKELLVNISHMVAQSYRYQNFPLDLIFKADELNPWQMTNVSMRMQGLHQMSAQTDEADLVLEIVTGERRSIVPRLLYHPAVFDKLFIQSFAGCFQHLLAAFADPSLELKKIELLTEAEKQRLLVDFNRTDVPYPRDKALHQVFEEIVEKTPDQIAIVFQDREFTYRQLNEAANRLAHYLREVCHIGVDDRVGLLADRSERMIIALLAILKAGGAYVPIEASYPRERVEQLLQDAGVRVLLIDSELMGSVENFVGPIFALDLQVEELNDYPATNPVNVNTATDLVYLMYTSGSTGSPKGVGITHRGVVRLVREASYVQLNDQEIFLQLAPLSFDASTFEIWGALLNGARLVVMPVTRPTLEELAESLARHQVSVLWLTAGLFHLVVDERLDALKPVRQLLAGGDVLSVPHVEKLLRELPQCTLINGYGPTESTTFACCYRMSHGETIERTVPLGRPISNTVLYVLDRNLQPVPTGISGELYIGGDGLARGYFNHPALTAEKFIPDSFGGKNGTRLYRTGDLVRQLPDGRIEFLGRRDQQVKVRGFRVEPGEVEALLARHPGVGRCIVLVDEKEPGQKRLVAHVVPAPGRQTSIEELRAYLLEKLPDYMLPATYVLLNEFPFTPNGKIDRRALAALAPANGHGTDGSFVGPRTREEQVLAECWAEVLKRERVGIDDDFFALGGDSINAIQVISRAADRGLVFSIQHLFQSQTIRELAAPLQIEELLVEPVPESRPFGLIGEQDRLKLSPDIEDAYPLTMLQLGMLFHSEYTPKYSTYHDVLSLKLGARLELESFESALDQLVARHAILRTSFDLTSFSEPLQLIHGPTSVPLPVTDLSDLSLEEQDEQINAFVTNERQAHFDWTSAPLLRLHLHRRSAEAFQLTLSFHHAILDGWSLATLLTEFLQLYTSQLNGEAALVDPAPVNAFRDFVALERELLATTEARDFWIRNLSNLRINELSSWSIGTGSAEPPQIGILDVDIPPEICDGLRSLSRMAAVPLKSVLLSAHLKVLSLLGRESDVLTGVVSHGRPESTDGEKALGLFLNTIPFRQKLEASTWVKLVQDVFDNERQCLPFSRYPLARIQNELGGGPLFKTAFNFVHFHVYQALRDMDHVEILEAAGSQQTNFALTANFQIDAFSDHIRLTLDYDSNVLRRMQVEKISEYYNAVLQSMSSDPLAACEDLPLVSENERRQLLEEWNATAREFPRERCVQELFEAQVSQRPEAVAVVYGAEQLSYGELNERANQLANYLRKRGVGPEVVVGVCLERSVELVVSLLGILKAGGAYLPLDPAYPEARRAYMLNDAHAQVVLTKAEVEESASESKENPERQGWAENLAYVIYTSGSTGAPKGVQIPHRGLVNLVSWHQQQYQLTPADRATHLASLTFDASVWELWPYLCAGASVYLVPNEVRVEPLRLLSWLGEQAITLSFLPTPLAEAMLGQEQRPSLALRTLLTGGDRLHRTAGASWSFELVNHYGPTECSVVSTCGKVAAGSEAELPGIGRPISNMQVYVLDQQQELAPVGVIGELYIGGAGLARGYVGAAALTAERFVPHPFSKEPGARLYKTGDLVRYTWTGELEFVGRVDQQLKIRGHRIESGEVESVLRAHEQVADAVVLGRQEENGQQRLIAYLVAAAAAAQLSVTELRRYVGETLPDYMVPAGFVYLAELPLNASGKVDRAALPAPEWAQTRSGHVGPRTKVEEVLCGIWAEVLRVERVSVHDDYFELGGDSILSIQIIAKARQQGLHLSPKLLFQYKNIAALSEHVKESQIGEAPQGVVTGEVLLTPIQHWFFEQQLPRPEHWNQAVLLETRESLNAELLERSWRELVTHHDGLRQRYRCEAGTWRQEIKAPSAADVVVTSYDWSGLSEAEQRQRLAESANELQRSLNLEQGPLVRVGWYARGAQGGWLLLIVHHLVVDGVSWRILLEDFEQVYAQLAGGQAVKLAPKSNSLVQWSEQLREYGRSEAVREEVAYWLEQGAVRVKPLPRDYAAGENVEASVGIASGSLSEAETQRLLQEVPGRYQTQITEVLLWGLVEALWKWSGERVVRVALEGHGREAIGGEVDVTRTVGWFTTLYPVVVDLRQVYERGAALKAVKEQLRRMPQRGIGYGVLRYLGDEAGAQLKEQEEAELSFNYLGQFDQVLKPGGWLRAAHEGSGVARYEAGRRRFLLDITSSVVNGQLQVSVLYSEALHRHETMNGLIAEYLRELRELIAQEATAVDYSPSDFPQARLSQRKLNELITRVGRTYERSGSTK